MSVDNRGRCRWETLSTCRLGLTIQRQKNPEKAYWLNPILCETVLLPHIYMFFLFIKSQLLLLWFLLCPFDFDGMQKYVACVIIINEGANEQY